MHDPVGRNSELAAELLDVVSESELEDFVRGLVGDAGIPAQTGRALVASLKQTAERTLPALSVALGDQRRPPAPVATQTAARLFGVETEGMSAEDRDFEIARQFVRYAQQTIAHAGKRG
jgi:hypothetical protein